MKARYLISVPLCLLAAALGYTCGLVAGIGAGLLATGLGGDATTSFIDAFSKTYAYVFDSITHLAEGPSASSA